jgi:hypothetical protein
VNLSDGFPIGSVLSKEQAYGLKSKLNNRRRVAHGTDLHLKRNKKYFERTWF